MKSGWSVVELIEAQLSDNGNYWCCLLNAQSRFIGILYAFRLTYACYLSFLQFLMKEYAIQGGTPQLLKLQTFFRFGRTETSISAQFCCFGLLWALWLRDQEERITVLCALLGSKTSLFPLCRCALGTKFLFHLAGVGSKWNPGWWVLLTI